MTEKFVEYPDYNQFGFYISRAENDIVVVPFGVNIFSYMDLLGEEIKKYADKEKLTGYSVYIDTLHLPSTEENSSVVKVGLPVNWLGYDKISFADLPPAVKSEIVRLYKKHRKKIEPALFASSKAKLEGILKRKNRHTKLTWKKEKKKQEVFDVCG